MNVDDRCRRFFLTLWPHKGFKLKVEVWDKYKNMKYCHIGGQETCPKTGRLHHHAIVYFKDAVSYKKIHKLFHSGMDIELLRSQKAAEKYIVKEKDTIYKKGTPPEQGRTKHVAIREHFKEGGTMKELLQRDELLPTISRSMKFTAACKLHFTPDRKEQTKLIWIWGPPRTGKSYRAEKIARDLCGDEFHVQCNTMGEWWDGYEQQKVCIIEEFRGQIALARFLSLFCWQPKIKVQVKGHSEKFTSQWIIVTSNLSWEETWNQEAKNYAVNIDAFEKRLIQFGQVKFMEKVYNSPKHVIKMKKAQQEISDVWERTAEKK
jgi:hypothetical protein